MHALTLFLSLAAAALPSSFAASHPAAHHAVSNAGSHGIFAASSRQGSSLLERSAAVSEERAMEDALCPPGDQSTANLTDDAWTDEAWEEDAVLEAVLGKRDIKISILNPKWPNNPKWTGRSSTAAATSTAGSSKSTSQASGASAQVAISAGIIVLGSGDSTSTSSASPSSSRSTTPSPTKTSFQSAASTSSSITTSKPTSTSTSATKTTSTSTTVLTLPSPPSTSCATPYMNTAGGAVYGPGLGNFSFSPRPSTFVKRSGTGLTLDGEEFRIVGPNIYWLGLDENVIPNPSYPAKGRIREAMAATVAMGGNTVRSHTLGISTGNQYSVWPNAYETNDEAFDTIDYSIWAARNYGLRLIIPLTDNYAYYHGGKYDFIGWAGLDTSDASQFYYSSDVVQIFKDYIAVLLNHTNAYTGVRLCDDPTIMAWETGNELGGYMLGGGAPPASWTKEIATYIKSLAPNHLVADGSDGLVDTTGALANTGLSVSPVDLVTDHFYPALQWLLTKDEGYLSSYSKSFFIGELDWTGLNGGTDLSSFYSSIESFGGSGSMMWSLFTHDAQCCNFVEHNDGYSLMYPNGNTAALQQQALLLMQHWYRMRGLTPPSALPAVACPQPPLEA